MNHFDHDDFNEDFKSLCFDFFYWFSRFEYALKENGYIKKGPYNAAMADWSRFKDDFADSYQIINEGINLISAPPSRQVCNDEGGYLWSVANIDREDSDLGKLILIIKSIRNNLFHGGKSSQDDWDNPDRNIFLISNSKVVLNSFASLNDSLWSEYYRKY